MINFIKKAARIIKSGANKVAGFFAGAASGFLSGFAACKYEMYDSFPNVFHGLLASLITSPLYLIRYSAQGAMFGAKKGLVAGLSFLKLVNRFIEMNKNKAAIYSELKEYNRDQFTFLSHDEIDQLKQKLNKPNPSEIEKNLKEQLDKYLSEIPDAKEFQEFTNPIGVKFGDDLYIADGNKFEKHVEDVINKQNPNLPFIFNNEKITVNNLINYKKLFPNLVAFIKTARNLLTNSQTQSSNAEIYRQIGTPVPSKKNNQNNQVESAPVVSTPNKTPPEPKSNREFKQACAQVVPPPPVIIFGL